jgi:acetyl esterase
MPEGFTVRASDRPDDDTRALLRELYDRGGGELAALSVAQARAWWDREFEALALSPLPELGAIEPQTIDVDGARIGARLYRPAEGRAKHLPMLVFYHAGGYVFGTLETMDSFCRLMTAGAGCLVLAVDYRRAPEHKFPVPLEDCYQATLWAWKNAERLGADPDRIAVGGDSSGGTMATVICHLARQRGAPEICHQFLWYPGVGSAGPSQSAKQYATGYFLENDLAIWSMKHYLNDMSELTDPRVQPIRFENFEGLPPAYLMTAGFDPRRDDNARYAERLSAAGVPVSFVCIETTIHGFLFMLNGIRAAREAAAQSAEYARAAFAGDN